MTRKRNLRDIMTPAPQCTDAGVPVTAAAVAMRDLGIGCVLVLDGGRLSGILTDRDIAVRVLAGGLDPSMTAVGDVCSRELVVLQPDDDVAEAVLLIREHAIRRIPVVEAGEPVGIISIGDLALDSTAGSPLADLSAAPANT